MSRFAHISSSTMDAMQDRAFANFSENEQRELQLMADIFNQMDTNKNNTITQEEFRRYVQKHPKGWPLVDLFRAKTMNQNERDLLVNFWFRKLDADCDGNVSFKEFLSMFIALKNTKVQESLYTDFLINLFDDDLDGRIDRAEFTKMMHVLFGDEPPQAVLDSMPEEGFDREALTRVMHSISMDYQLLPSSTMTQTQSGMFNLGQTESRVWDAESGVYVLTPASAGEGNTFPKKSVTTSIASDRKEAAKKRNKERKEAADGVTIVLAIAATAAITAGLCVFAAVYGRKIGKF